MPDPKTLPQSFMVASRHPPGPGHAVWLDRTERLLGKFEDSLPNEASQPHALGFILLLADHLWDELGEQADFARLDVHGLVVHCHALLCGAGVAASFANTLSAFYAFLARRQEIDAQAAAAIASQLLALPNEFERRD
jgi:hypothetical protein